MGQTSVGVWKHTPISHHPWNFNGQTNPTRPDPLVRTAHPHTLKFLLVGVDLLEAKTSCLVFVSFSSQRVGSAFEKAQHSQPLECPHVRIDCCVAHLTWGNVSSPLSFSLSYLTISRFLHSMVSNSPRGLVFHLQLWLVGTHVHALGLGGAH